MTAYSLPTICPDWCNGQHAQALEEGCPIEDAREHLRSGPGALLHELRNPVDGRVMRPYGGGYNLTIRQMPFPEGHGLWSSATIVIELDRKATREVAFTSGEARTLAAQLLALANEIDRC